MKATKTDKEPYLLNPGEYNLPYAKTPNGLLANLERHSVVEYENGLTVSPSILVTDGNITWHGFIAGGIWKTLDS